MTQYEQIMQDNLLRCFSEASSTLPDRLGGRVCDQGVCFRAFGEKCAVYPDRILFSGAPDKGPLGLLIALLPVPG